MNKAAKFRLFQSITGWSTDKMRFNRAAINRLLTDDDMSNYVTEEELVEILQNYYQLPDTGIPAKDIESGVIPDVKGNISIPQDTNLQHLDILKIDDNYYETENNIGTSQPQNGFLPNIIYDLGELTGQVTFALAAPTNQNKPNPYHWTFDTGSTAPTITWPNNIIWPDGVNPTIEADKHYEVLVRNGYGSILVYSIPVLP